MRHFLLMALYAACVASFFATLMRDDWKAGRRLFLTIFGIMVGGAFVAGWLMLLVSG